METIQLITSPDLLQLIKPFKTVKVVIICWSALRHYRRSESQFGFAKWRSIEKLLDQILEELNNKQKFPC